MRHWLLTLDGPTRFLLWSPLLLLVSVLALTGLQIFVAQARTWVWKVLLGIAVLMIAGQAVLGLYWVPPEHYMGDVYRIIYMHVPQVWMALIGMTINFGCCVLFLFRKSWVTDSLAEASASVGVYFGAVGITLGAVWAKPTWGAYWTWDPRLTTAAIMLVIYTGYLALRRFVEDPDKRATWSAVLGIVAYVDIPVLWFSVKWWRSIHQEQSSPKTVDSLMTMVLRWSATMFLSLFVVFVYHRYLAAQAARAREVAAPELLPPSSSAPAVSS